MNLPHSVPQRARVHLAHAAVQRHAEQVGARLLHLKGPAADPHLRTPGRGSRDADVLVHPDDVAALESQLRGAGWEQRTTAKGGSSFGHAANWWHDHFGYVDIHHRWPGPSASPDVVFERLARGGRHRAIAHVPCPIPGETEQLFVLMLHAARSTAKSDVWHGWANADDATRAAVRALAVELGAEVPLAIGVGDPVDPRHPEVALWTYHATGQTNRRAEWRAKVRAQTSLRGKARVLASAVRVNRDHLRLELGHEPTTGDLWRAQLRLLRRAVRR